MQYTIRNYEVSDCQAVVEVWRESTRLAHDFMTEDFISREQENVINLYLPNADTWVVETRNTVIGFISLFRGEVGAIFLKPSHHGMGLGRLMMDKVRDITNPIELEVFECNHIGRRFYNRYGFTEVARSIHPLTNQPVIRLRYEQKG